MSRPSLHYDMVKRITTLRLATAEAIGFLRERPPAVGEALRALEDEPPAGQPGGPARSPGDAYDHHAHVDNSAQARAQRFERGRQLGNLQREGRQRRLEAARAADALRIKKRLVVVNLRKAKRR